MKTIKYSRFALLVTFNITPVFAQNSSVYFGIHGAPAVVVTTANVDHYTAETLLDEYNYNTKVCYEGSTQSAIQLIKKIHSYGYIRFTFERLNNLENSQSFVIHYSIKYPQDPQCDMTGCVWTDWSGEKTVYPCALSF